MKKLLSTTLLGLAVIAVSAQVKPAKPVAKPSVSAAKPQVKPASAAPVANILKNESDSASYALGVRIAQNLKSQNLEPLNLAVLQRAMADVLQAKKLIIEDQLLDNCIGSYQQKMSGQKSTGPRKAGQAFLATNGKRAGVITLPSGMQYEVLRASKDTVRPTIDSKVKCHYHGTVLSGEVFDSSVDRGEPVTFPLRNVIRGWQEGLPLMTVGSKYKFYIPADLAYGDQQRGEKILPGSLLIFEVELLGVE